MQLLYTKPRLNDLSQGSSIAFARQFRTMSQDEVSDILGLNGECKRRTMTRYEKGDRNPKLKRLEEISSILKVNINSLKEYDFNNPIDVVYIFMWMAELIPNYVIDVSKVPRVDEYYIDVVKKSIEEWTDMRIKRLRKEISYEDYIEWKLNYEIKEEL